MINGLGLKGSEEMGEKVLAKLGIDGEKVDVDISDVESSEEMIYSKAVDVFGKGEKVCFVGGDHSITYPIFKAFNEAKIGRAHV